MLKSITMTIEQTDVYDDGGDQEQRALMASLRQQAQRQADETGDAVEIYTADGIVADVVYPS